MKSDSRAFTRMKIKFFLFFVLFVVALFSIIAFTAERQIQQAVSITVAIAGMPVLERASAFIDGDKYERLARTLDPSDPFFQETQEKFRQLKAETACLYLYSLIPYKEDVHLFIFDAEDPDSENYTNIGEEEDISGYDVAYRLAYETKTPQASRMIFQTKWGHLISAYMPILNSKGEVVGVIGADFQGQGIREAIFRGLAWQIAFVVMFIAVGLFFYFMLLKALTRQNRELLEMSRLASAASRAKSEFLARMSHEIRTPMNAVIGMSELVQRNYGTPKGLEYVSGIKIAGASLLDIINDILDFSKIESGRLELAASPYETASLLHDVLTIIRIRMAEKPLELLVDAAPGLPGRLIGDAGRVKQILLNLLNNAVKYTDQGFIKLSVSGERSAKREMRLAIKVEDSGRGIRPEDLPKLFDDFARLDEKRNSAVEGTGLGLSIARSLCRAMGGEITAASEYGRGSVFTATLNQAVDAWEPMGDVADVSATDVDRQRISFTAPEAEVLVVDDFPSNLLVAEGLLSPYKMRIFTCLNGREAVETVQARSFDLVLMDHMMPEMDGQEATRAIRALGGSFAELPIAALTANAVAGMREKFLENGFNDFLAKPIDTALLDAVLRKWIPDAKQRSVPEGGESAPYEAGETLPAIEGLDMAAGIARIGGAPGRYRELLRVFLTDVEARFGLLEASPDAAGLPAFIIAVHALKSALANIGANALSESAAGLELAGRNGDLALIGGKLASFREGLAALAARIGEALAEADGAGLETAPAPLYLEALAGLQAALEARDTDGLDAALAKLQSLHLAPERRGAAAGIARHVLFGDFKKALEAVNALL